jgi:hypothetical protein
MLPRVCRLLVILALVVLPVFGTAPAHAQVEGPCVVEINGVGVDRIDSLDSPLELGASDILVFTGSNETGTTAAAVRLAIGPITVERGSSTYGTPEPEFGATIALEDVSPYGVGLFRVVAEADGCLAKAWVRVSGRFPLATLTGLTALGLALGGITGQLGAIVSRSRWTRSAAALGGIATGTGIAVLSQQFGRLQVSYPSVAALSAIAAVVGFGAAWLLNPELREARLDRRPRSTPVEATAPAAEARETDERQVEETDRQESGVAAEERVTVPDREEDTEAARAAPRPDAPYWCYVMAPTDVFDLTDHTTTVAMLIPGTWYLAKRTIGGWAHVVASEGQEGWVAEGAIHRQG